MTVFISALFVLAVGVPAHAVAPPVTLPPVKQQVMTTWDDVHAYIVTHATVWDATTEGLLQDEAEAGIKTWVSVAATGGGGESWLERICPRPLDGPGVGWPSAGHVILFATTSERDTAASLIDDVTAGREVQVDRWRYTKLFAGAN